MVVLYFSINKKDFTQDLRHFADYIKKSVIGEDAKKCVGFNLSVMKDLQLSNLDSMLKISDEVFKTQHEIEQFLKALEKRVLELQPEFQFRIHMRGTPQTIEEAISTFQWDEQKYPKHQKSVDYILDKIAEKFKKTSNDLKIKSDEFTAEEEKLKQKQKSDSEAAAFMKKDYREILKRKTNEMVVNSEYLTSLLVFVPKNLVDQFKKQYQVIVKDCVVPFSATQLDNNEDDKMTMWRVVIMRHKKEEYFNEARKLMKVICKEYDKDEISNLPNLMREKRELEDSIQEKKVSLLI